MRGALVSDVIAPCTRTRDSDLDGGVLESWVLVCGGGGKTVLWMAPWVYGQRDNFSGTQVNPKKPWICSPLLCESALSSHEDPGSAAQLETQSAEELLWGIGESRSLLTPDLHSSMEGYCWHLQRILCCWPLMPSLSRCWSEPHST